MGTFKTFKEWLGEQEPLDQIQQRNVNKAVSKSLNSLAPDQAMGAIQGTNLQAQKKLVARSLSKSDKGIDDIAPVVGIKTKPVTQMMRKR